MTTKRAFSIISIACFISVLFIPIGIVLMIFYTDWKKKIKFILSVALSALYILLAILFLNFQPSYYNKGVSVPVPVNTEITQNETATTKQIDSDEELNQKSVSKKNKETDAEPQEPKPRLPKSVTKKRGTFFQSRYFYIIMFFVFMLFLIIWQNIKNKNKDAYDNPYMDTNKIKLPLEVDSKLPMVHFQKLRTNQNEKIFYATETTKKEDEGDFVVTNQRVVVFTKSGDYEFPLSALSAVSSVSNTVMLLTCGERKYYIFFPEGQLKYALAVVRWAYSNQTGKN